MAFKTKDGTWRVLIRKNGRRSSKNFPTKALAEIYESKAKLGQFEPVRVPKCRLTFAEFSERWLTEYASVEVAETTAMQYRGDIRKHFVPAFGSVKLADLTMQHLLAWRSQLKKSPKTLNNLVTLAKGILNAAVRWHSPTDPLIAVNPWANVSKLPVDEQDFEFWDAAERDSFIERARFINPKFVEAVTFAAFTGLRLGEIRGLRRNAIDFDQSLITVKRVYSERTKKEHRRTKNRKVGWVPMHDKVRKILLKRVDYGPSCLVFERDVLKGACVKLRRLCKRVGITSIKFHGLRHTFASCLVMNEVDVYTVSRLVRHSSVSQTQGYAHLAPQYLQKEIKKLSGTDLAPIETSGDGKASQKEVKYLS